jgi:hypothetical protein
MHAELLEPAVEHDGYEDELPFPAPLPGEANPRVTAGTVGRDLPAAAVPRAEPHVAVRTACTSHTRLVSTTPLYIVIWFYVLLISRLPDNLDGDVEDVEVEGVIGDLPPLSDAHDDDEDG